MAFSKYVITFTEVPVVNEVLQINESFTSTSLIQTFKVNRGASFQTKIPTSFDGAVTGDPPFYIYSGFISNNYKTAFNLDYNVAVGYTVTTTVGAAGTGIGTVTVEATFDGASFTEITVPAGASVVITNVAPPPQVISVTSTSFITATSLPCANVDIIVTTNILAVTYIINAGVDIANTDNPFTITGARGTVVNLIVFDINDNDFPITITMPPVLNVNLFTATVTNDFAGYTATITNTLPAGLTLEYSIDGLTWQSSNVFNDVPLGLSTVIIRDNYDCYVAIDFEVERLILPIFVRSTYSFRVTPAVNFTNASLELYTYSGDVNDEPIEPNYTLTKSVIQMGQTSISFDINHLVKEVTVPTIANYQLSGVQNSDLKDTCWLKYNVSCFDGVNQVYTLSGILISMYGYGYFKEGFNPLLQSKVLISNDRQTHYRGENNRLYFITDKLTSLTVNGVEVVITADLDLNTQYVKSINVNDYDVPDTAVFAFVYEDETRTITYDVLDECKYDIINCVFINKYGFPQSFFLTKARKYTDEVDSEEYRGLTSEFGVYDTTKHQFTNFNLNGRTAIVCNTDYLNEYENEVVKQMLLSEKKWFIIDGIIYPVNLESKSVAYKTELNDKLIQYTLNFKNSFDIINQVQ